MDKLRIDQLIRVLEHRGHAKDHLEKAQVELRLIDEKVAKAAEDLAEILLAERDLDPGYTYVFLLDDVHGLFIMVPFAGDVRSHIAILKEI